MHHHQNTIGIRLHLFLGTNDLRQPWEVFLCNAPTEIARGPSQKVQRINNNGLIDYVDFGAKGNLFLHNIGVCNEPQPAVLATLLLNRQAIFFDTRERLEQDKLNTYRECLKRLAAAIIGGIIHFDQALISRLRNEPWCLGFIYNEDLSGAQVFRITRPVEIFLIDDPVTASYFHPLCPPAGRDLNDLYEKFGSRWLEDCVQKKYTYRGIFIVSGHLFTLNFSKGAIRSKIQSRHFLETQIWWLAGNDNSYPLYCLIAHSLENSPVPMHATSF